MTCHNERAATARRLEALRDFFMARDADDLADAWIKLTRQDERTLYLPTPPAIPDWEAVEFSFNRLFVGPQPPLAPPFSSIYLDSEPYVMGPSTMEVRNIYRLLGLQSPLEGSFPDDHVSLELDALLAMDASLEWGGRPELASMRNYFLEQHMLAWIPEFCDGVYAQEATHPAIIYAAMLLVRFLLDLADTTGCSPREHQFSARTATVEDNAS